MKILLTAGARPNFMKLSPIIRALKKYPEVEYKIVHTGQHYDNNMNDIFFHELNIPKPDYNLGVGSASHAQQTAKIMLKFEEVCLIEKPDIIIVIGDVNSTLACSLVASKLHIKVAHIEAGYRSYDLKMPEEINRICTDTVSDYLFCTIYDAVKNLIEENYEDDKIFLVGDTMVDNILYNVNKIKDNPYNNVPYILLTMHRDSNVDNKEKLEEILKSINYLTKFYQIIFPVHPRTKIKIDSFNLHHYLTKIKVLPPLGYIDFLTLIKYSKLIITDSGGLQRESSILNIPCVVLRNTTEHIDILKSGHSVLVGCQYLKIISQTIERMKPTFKLKKIENKLNDGKASDRIVKIITEEN